MYRNQQYKFCKICKKFHSYKVLVHQVTYGEPVEDRMIAMAQTFQAPYSLADALEISPPTLYRWLRHYFRMRFMEFREVYILGKVPHGIIKPTAIGENKDDSYRLYPFDFRSLGINRGDVDYDKIPAVTV